jgi:hypothetical protein
VIASISLKGMRDKRVSCGAGQASSSSASI